MAKLNISKSIQIDAPVATVFEKLNDFHHWRPWSPWLIQDPVAKVDVAEDGKYYNWTGDLTGEGEMTVLNEVANESIDYDLTFLKPWKSKAKVRFEVAEKNGGTNVTWLMDSSLPFFLFFMKKMMNAMIGKDYERGLAMLKDYVEKGEVPSKIDFKGTNAFPGCTYIGVKTACTMEDIGPKMEADFTSLWDYLKGKEDSVAGAPFSIYHKWDMVKGNVLYTSGVPVKEVPADLPSGFITGTIPATEVYTVKHTGDYGHLGNAWSTMYSMKQNKKFKMNKSIDPFETYNNDPSEVAAKDLVTEVHFAVK